MAPPPEPASSLPAPDVAQPRASGAGRHQYSAPGDADELMARRIAGVMVRRLPGYHDDRGALVPFFDRQDPFWSEPIVHGCLYTVAPGRIKGWGLHRLQADRYFVASGDLRVVLFDGREGSPDRGNFCELFFTTNHHGLIYIPPGVWHATQNFGRTLGRIVNLPTVAYDPANPDKERIDPHSGKIPFDWRLRDG